LDQESSNKFGRHLRLSSCI